jgi:hypothetical protein
MRSESFDYISGQSLGEIPLSFGDLIQNQHCVKPIVVKFLRDSKDSTDISNVRLKIEDKGIWTGTLYSYYQDASFSRIESGSVPFLPFPDSTVNLSWDGTSTDFVWLDAQIKLATGITQATFKLLYDVP